MLSIIGFVIVIVATYYVYKTAKDYGRNAVVWAIATFCLGFGIQFVVPFILGLILAVLYMSQGTTDAAAIQERILGPAIVIGIVSIALSGVAMWVMLRMVSRLPDEPPVSQPPPPPDFQ